MREFNPVFPYDFGRLYGPEKYSLQNMLLKQVNFPRHYDDKADKLYDVWSDRVHAEWREAADLLDTNETGDSYLAGATDASFLAFASRLFSLINKEDITLSGAAAVRHTNAASGYPVIYIMGIVYSGNRVMGLPLFRQSRERHPDIYGAW